MRWRREPTSRPFWRPRRRRSTCSAAWASLQSRPCVVDVADDVEPGSSQEYSLARPQPRLPLAPTTRSSGGNRPGPRFWKRPCVIWQGASPISTGPVCTDRGGRPGPDPSSGCPPNMCAFLSAAASAAPRPRTENRRRGRRAPGSALPELLRQHAVGDRGPHHDRESGHPEINIDSDQPAAFGAADRELLEAVAERRRLAPAAAD